MATRRIGIVLALVLLVAACDSESSSDSEPAAAAPSENTVPEAAPVATEAPASPQPTPTAPPAVEVLMPNVVCMNLQAAQDLIQEAGVFFSRSVDALGANRLQMLDRNWVVLSQEPSAGTPIEEFEAVLAVVKYGEPGAEQCG